MLEAMACGLPVAAYPVTGPVDVLQHGVTGILNTDLAKAGREALTLDRGACRSYAESRSCAAVHRTVSPTSGTGRPDAGKRSCAEPPALT